MKSIILTKAVNTPYLVGSGDGATIYKILKRELKGNENIYVSLKGVKSLASAFLNPSIGRLLKSYEKELLEKRIIFQDASETHRILISRVLKTASEFYNNRNEYEDRMKAYYGNNS